ncbi:DUF4326 domain-containing protein [Paenarthrobacter nitroguajacolicus]|uniref:DUF4326 domain-containing protein n=1 Tax=Paenarthrobacter nitroguajacolicus TaxID=211146 RepID=UPI003AD92489
MPDNTVYVGRPSKWSNPFKVGAQGFQFDDGSAVFYRSRFGASAATVVELFRKHEAPKLWQAARTELKGKNLACWCPLDQPCHADVLLELANDDEHWRMGKLVRFWRGVRHAENEPETGIVAADGPVLFGGTVCIRVLRHVGGSDVIQLSHIEPLA